MSKLQDLIQELCPNGVEYKKLGDLGVFENIGVDKKIIEGQQLVSLLNYVDVYKNIHIDNNIPKMIVSASFKKIQECTCEKGDIFITPTSETKDDIGHASVVTETLVNTVYSYHIMRFRLKEFQMTTSFFIRYLFETDLIQKQIYKLAKGLTRFGLSKYDFAKIEIPLPPLPVQEEIVKILDRFAVYTAELQAELQARKEQYEYYRNLLLNFNHAYGAADEQQKKSVTTWGGHSYEIQWKTLGEIGKFYGGLTGKSKTDFDNGNAKYVTYMNVFNNLAINTDIKDKVKISMNENQNIIEYGDAIFTGSSETPEECGMSSVLTKKIEEPLYLNSFCFGLRFNDKTIFNPEFLKHLLRSKLLREQIKKTANGVTRFNVSKKLFAKILVPIPPLELQERIVAILDKFETLVNDLSQGLPAEIAAIQEQYEYYRNKLLTFKQVA